MANPTTAFGWVMPTTTDLVTDLPADFAVFGQGVDTSMQYLLGGTTGQVLSKTSATNMAFTWIANDQGDLTAITAGTGISVTSSTGPVPTVAIDTTVTVDKTTSQTLTNKTLTSPALTTPTISTATTNGDILYGTGSGALARLGIGSASQVLTVSGGIPAWTTPTSGSLTLLSTTSLSTITTTISSISTAYKSLKLIIVDAKPVASGQEFFMRVNGDTGSNYTTVSTYGTTTAAGNVQTYGSTTSNVLTNGNFSMANTNNHTFIVDLVDYTNVDSVRVFNAQMYFENFSNAKTVQQQVMAYFTVGTAITSITLFLGGSTFSAGTAYLYGVN